MDLAVKTIVKLLLTFIAMMLLLSTMVFYIVSVQAREVMYSTIENIEQNGYDPAQIDRLAQKTNTTINVMPIDVGEDYYKYDVTVGYNHIFAFINFNKKMTITGSTRKVQY